MAGKSTANVRESRRASNRDLWFRMYEVVSHFASVWRPPSAAICLVFTRRLRRWPRSFQRLTSPTTRPVCGRTSQNSALPVLVSSCGTNDRTRARNRPKRTGAANDTTLAELSRSSEIQKAPRRPLKHGWGPADPADVLSPTPAADRSVLFPQLRPRWPLSSRRRHCRRLSALPSPGAASLIRSGERRQSIAAAATLPSFIETPSPPRFPKAQNTLR